MAYNAQLRRYRLSKRRPNKQGRLVSTIAPEHVHGRAMGYIQYGCHCDPCNEWSRWSRQNWLDTRIHNALILRDMGLLREPTSWDEWKRLRTSGEQEAPTTDDPVPPAPPEVTETPEAPRLELVPGTVADRPAPPVSAGVRERITAVATVEAIKRAYYEPAWTAPQDLGRERRAADDMEIVVAPNGDAPPMVIWFHEREAATGKSTVLQPVTGGIAKVKGGRGGSDAPNTFQDLIKALERTGCEVSRTGSGHVRISKNGQSIILPSSASDVRSLKNAVAQARREGLLA